MKKYKLIRKRNYYGNDIIKYGSLCLIVVSVYIIVNALTPMVSLSQKASAQSTDINNSIDNSKGNRIIIPKLDLEVNYFTGNQQVLNKGAWNRFPERGNPRDGGNFILAAHRFKLDWTPWHTNRSSPFYNLNKLTSGDKIYVSYDNNIYEYQVSKTYEVDPNSTEIESKTTESRLTLYTCTLGGSDDGRLVVEAIPTSSKLTDSDI